VLTFGARVDGAPGSDLADRIVCVDLDGTLIAGDLLWESLVELFRRDPIAGLVTLLTLVKGKAAFKRRVAEQVAIDPSMLSYRTDVLDRLQGLYQRGARLVLATASDERYATSVARYLGIFDEVVASDGHSNLSGDRKAAALVDRYGRRGFDYFGNDWADVPVWRVAAEGTAVGVSPRLAKFATAEGVVQRVTTVRPSGIRSAIKALRPHQWVKNLLVFVPLAAAHQFLNETMLAASVLAFVAFCLCASAIYVINDILDVAADRLHARKRHRPFAAGELSVPVGVAMAGLLLIVALTVAAAGVSPQLAAVVLIYVAITSAYSLVLKRLAVVDVFTLAGLYVLRIVAGSVATGIVLSSWLLAFALFLFLSLAFIKRYTELRTTDGRMAGRGYGADDAMWMHSVGTSAGHMAILVLALYVSAPDVAALYSRPQVLWALCPVFLFWLTRLWFRAGRGVIHDDPVVEALKDPASYVAAAAALTIMVAAAL
jgi:4-hydroxybenzoate polyprenyltransferase